MSDNGSVVPPIIYCHICHKMVTMPLGSEIPDRSAEAYNAWRREHKCPECKNTLDQIRLG